VNRRSFLKSVGLLIPGVAVIAKCARAHQSGASPIIPAFTFAPDENWLRGQSCRRHGAEDERATHRFFYDGQKWCVQRNCGKRGWVEVKK
jgi:hypothetical protein